MYLRRLCTSAALATLSLSLSPLTALAASTVAEPVSEETVLEALDEKLPSMNVGGGGGEYYPGPYGTGITVDASITKEVTPDFVAINGYCERTNRETREDVRMELTKLFNSIKEEIGDNGRVRRTGSPTIYPYYDPSTGTQSARVSGSISIFIRVVNIGATQKIADILERHECGVNWDVRLVDTQDYEMALLDSLISKVNKRKTVFQKLLGKKLTNVTGASLSTWVDGWSTYDPDTNKADATTTLSITFDTGARARVVPFIDTKPVPKG